MSKKPVFIIGAGPAGLSAANELACGDIYKPVVLEKCDQVGGISRTEKYKDYFFDVGGHRFFTNIEPVQQLWQKILGEDLKIVPRLSRIYFDKKFFNYPLKKRNILTNLGLYESLLIVKSYLKAKLFPVADETTFDRWIINRFGVRLYETFFKSYTEKVWGIPCHSIQSDWAAQRIQGLSMMTAIADLLLGLKRSKSMLETFHYPVLGPGMMWDGLQQNIVSNRGEVSLNAEVTRIVHSSGKISGLDYQKNGTEMLQDVDNVISSTPINRLVSLFDPPPPEDVLLAAGALSYRSFLIVNLIIGQKALFPDQWIYVHWPEVKVGRIQNFKNWSREMVPDPEKSSVGLEYFCSEGDEIWLMSDAALTEMAARELETLGLSKSIDVEDSYVIRQPNAYPVYDQNYQANLATIRSYLAGFENLQTVGRNGLHRYNNMDHSMITGIMAAQNLEGAQHDIWQFDESESASFLISRRNYRT
jgi:protoporphyrinogen oxidase